MAEPNSYTVRLPCFGPKDVESPCYFFVANHPAARVLTISLRGNGSPPAQTRDITHEEALEIVAAMLSTIRASQQFDADGENP